MNYNEDEEEIAYDDEGKEMEEEIKEEQAEKKWKREDADEERVSNQGPDVMVLPLSLVHPHPQPEEKEKVNSGGVEGEVLVNNRRKSWRNFNVRTVTMGIFREAMNPQILVENQEQPQLEELIDPAILVITDNARETSMNLLNNAQNSMIDNFRSIKWSYHELDEVREKVCQLEGNKKKIDNENQEDQEDRDSLVERRIKNLENYNHNLANQMISLLNSINDNILSLSGDLKDRGMLAGEDGKDKGKARSDDDKATNSTFTSLD